VYSIVVPNYDHKLKFLLQKSENKTEHKSENKSEKQDLEKRNLAL
ncbi:22369_t:CDS:1, partial [Gigaspora rosea]